MGYTVETVNDCTKKLVFEFSDVDLSSQVEKVLSKKRADASLKGFRKGKAPMSLIKQVYGPQAESDALYQFISSKFFEAVQEEDIKVIGYPSFANTEHKQGAVKFEAVVEHLPPVELKSLEGLSFKKDKVVVEDKDVEDLKNRYLESKSVLEALEEEGAQLKEGQTAIFNFEGEKEDGEKPENMKAEEFSLEIGSKRFIPGFEDGMIGMKVGEKKTINVTFPEDYQETSLQNAKVKFHVELLEIKEKKVPEFTDELAKEFGFESVDDFNTKNFESIKNQRERAAKEKLHQEVLEKLIELNPLTIPQALLEQQKKSVQDDLKKNLLQQGFNESMAEEYFTKWDKDITDKALFQVQSGLILDKLAKEHNIETSDADLEAKFEEMSTMAGLTVDQVKEYYGKNEDVKKNLRFAVREEKTFAKLLEQVNVTEA